MVIKCVSVPLPALDCWLSVVNCLGHFLSRVNYSDRPVLLAIKLLLEGTCFNHGNSKLHTTSRSELRNQTETRHQAYILLSSGLFCDLNSNNLFRFGLFLFDCIVKMQNIRLLGHSLCLFWSCESTCRFFFL